MASPAKPRRPWYRPHFSTCVVTALVALCFCFWNVAGYYRNWNETFHYRNDSVWLYGWPATYLERSVERISPDGIVKERLDDSLTWRLWERATSFFPGALSLDLAVGGAASLLLGSAFEIWRRRRARLLQVYLGELGVLTAVVCGFLGGGRYLVVSTATEEEVLQSLKQQSLRSSEFEFESGTPEFLHRWLPGIDYKAGDSVTEVRIHHPLSESQMGVICHLRGLRSLHLDARCPSNIWEMVSGCRQLEKIWIDSESLVDDDLAVLAKLPGLRKVYLGMGTVSDASLRHVGEIKTLRELSLSESSPNLIGEGLKHLAASPLTNLEISFDKSGCNECDLTPIGQIQHLRELSIFHKRLTSRDAAALGKLSDLDELNLINCYFADSKDGAILFHELRNLRELHLGLDSISPETGRAISELRGLKMLVVTDSDFFNDDAAWISQIASLRELHYYFEGKQNWSSGFARLRQLPHLETLSLSGLGIMDEDIDHFVQMKSLKTLKLGYDNGKGTGIQPADIKRLEKERPDLKVTLNGIYFL